MATTHETFEAFSFSFPSSSSHMNIICIYRPPPNKNNKFSTSDSIQEIQDLQTSSHARFVILGDLIFQYDSEKDSCVKSLKSFISDAKLNQIIKTPTHASTHILDWVILQENNVFLNDHHVVDKAISDDFSITCDSNMRKSVTIFKRELILRNLKTLDRDKFRCDISCALQTAEIEVNSLRW